MDTTGFNIQKEIEKSYKVEQALIDEIKSEEEQEQLLRESCISIAESLMKTPKVRTQVDGRDFLIAMTIRKIPVKKIHLVTKDIIEVPEDHISIVMADINKHKLTGGKYMPYTATGKVDKSYSVRDNLVTVIEGLLRHITGLIKPEILE